MHKRSAVSFIVSAFIALAIFSLSGCGGSSSTTATTATGATVSGQVVTPAKGAKLRAKLPSKSKIQGKSKAARSSVKARTLKNQMILARRAKLATAPQVGLEGATCQLIDAETKKAVTDSNGQAITATTDSNGDYTLNGVPPGKSYAIVATKLTDSNGDGTLDDGVVIKMAIEEVKEGETAKELPDANEESTMACEKYLDEVEKHVNDANFDPDSINFDEFLSFYEKMSDEEVENLYDKYDDEIDEAAADGSFDLDEVSEVDSAADAVSDLFTVADESFEETISSILGSDWETMLEALDTAIATADETLHNTLAAQEATQQKPEEDYFEYLAKELTALGITTTADELHTNFDQADATLQATLDNIASTQADIDAAYERFYAEQELIGFGVDLDDVDTELDSLEDALAAALAANPTGSVDSFGGSDFENSAACPEGMVPDPAGGCTTPSMDGGFMCPEGSTFDETTGGCLDTSGGAVCPTGTHEDTTTGECFPDFITCPEGSHYDDVSASCVSDTGGEAVCPEGTVKDPSTGECVLDFNVPDTTQPGELTEADCLSFGGTYDATTMICTIPEGNVTTDTTLTQVDCEAKGGHYDTATGECHLPTMTAKAKKASTTGEDPVFLAWEALWEFVDFNKADIVGDTLGITVTKDEVDIVNDLIHVGFVDVDGNNILEESDVTMDYQAIETAAQAAVANSTQPSEPDWAAIYADGDISEEEKTTIEAYYASFDDYYDAYNDAYEAAFNDALTAGIVELGTAKIAWAASAETMVDKFTAIQNIHDDAYDAYIAAWDGYWAGAGNGYEEAYKAYDAAVDAAYAAVITQTGAADADEAQDIISTAYALAQSAYWDAVDSVYFDDNGNGVADAGEYAYELLDPAELNSIASQFDDVPGESLAGDMEGFFDELGASDTQLFTVKDAADSLENGEITGEEFETTMESVFTQMFKDKGVDEADVTEFFQDVDTAEADYLADVEDAADGDDDDGDGVDTVDEAIDDLVTDLKAAMTENLVDASDAAALVQTQQDALLDTLLMAIAGEKEEEAQAKLRAKGKAV